MTGAEHYTEAERLLNGPDGLTEARLDNLRAAQVHAILALAAATAWQGTRRAGLHIGGGTARSAGYGAGD